MDIESILISNRSKIQIQNIIETIIESPQKLEELIKILMDKNLSPIHYRAAWVLGYLAPLGNDAFQKYWKFLLELLKKEDQHPTITRSITRLFQKLELPEKYHGQLIDISFNILTSEKQSLAQRANTMTILFNYSRKYPDIQNELRYVIQELLQFKSEASIQSRGIKILNQLNKIHNEH
jgi:hypothetical protein